MAALCAQQSWIMVTATFERKDMSGKLQLLYTWDTYYELELIYGFFMSRYRVAETMSCTAAV